MHRKKGQLPGSPHPRKPWYPDIPGHCNNRVNHHIKDILEDQISRLRDELIICPVSPDTEINSPSGERKG